MSTPTVGRQVGTSDSFADAGPRNFRLLASGQGLSWVGDSFQPIALSVAIVAAGGSATELGILMAAGVVARLVCTLVGGVWADRLAPQRLMIAADVARACGAAALAVVFLGDARPLVPLCLLMALMGGAGAFFHPAMASIKAVIVAPAQRQASNATLSMLQTGASIVGPATGGLLVATAGPSVGFAVNAATYVVSAVTVSLVRGRTERAPRTGFLTEIRGGWAAIQERDWLLWGVLSAGVYHVANGVVLVLVQVVAIRELGGAGAVGVIATAMGAGGFVGSLLALRLRPRRPLLVGYLALGLMPLWVLSYVWPGVLGAVLVGTFTGYAGLMFFSICWDTALQDHVPHHLLARVSSWDILTSFVGMPLGNALAGPLADRYGVHPVLGGCAVVLLVAGLAPLAARGTSRLGRASG
jgi:MFS family permease